VGYIALVVVEWLTSQNGFCIEGTRDRSHFEHLTFYRAQEKEWFNDPSEELISERYRRKARD
jgi:hypothetical protein